MISSMTRGGHPGSRKNGNRHTKGYHQSRHHHENKRDVSLERSIQEVVRGNIETNDAPLPDIALLDIEEINRAIRDVTKNGDVFQDVWVSIVENNINDIDEIALLAHEINHKYYSEEYSRKFTFLELEKNISTIGDNPLTFEDLIEGSVDGGHVNEFRLSNFKKGKSNPGVAYYHKNGKPGDIYEPNKKYSISTRKQVLIYRSSGDTYREIMKKMRENHQLNISQGCLTKWINDPNNYGVDIDIPIKPSGWLESSIDKMKMLHSEGVYNHTYFKKGVSVSE